MDRTPHVAILPSPGMGHLIPLAEFAKLLVEHHRFSATVIIPTSGPPTKSEKQVLAALPNSINYIFLPPVDLPKDLPPELQIILTVKFSLPSLRGTLASLKATTRLVSFVSDLFGVGAYGMVKEFGISTYIFFTTNAMCLLFSLQLPKLDKTTTCQYKDLPEPIKLPGCVELRGSEFFDPVQDRLSENYKAILEIVKLFSSADGIILNSFWDLEEEAIKALLQEETFKKPIYPVGPIIQTGSGSNANKPECLTWLDCQPKKSVLFVSFGSGGTLSSAQLTELAQGLELSGQRFLWVVRAPNDKASSGAFFDAHTPDDPLCYLPNGFLDRTKSLGLVVSSWVPQIEVLGHGSIGGFMTHCGWNSTLESIIFGVPLIAWPLYAEQKMNAVMLTEGVHAALRLKKSENGIVERDEISKVVGELMEDREEGKKVRERAAYLKDVARRALSEDGSSMKSLSQLVIKLQN